MARFATVLPSIPPPPYPPLHSTTGTPHSQSWRIFPYNSFICPSIHFENVNSCASSLFDYSCFISCIYVFSPSPSELSFHFPQSGGGCSPATFHFGSESRLVFIFVFRFRFLENRLINWGRNHYKRYSHSQPLIPISRQAHNRPVQRTCRRVRFLLIFTLRN